MKSALIAWVLIISVVLYSCGKETAYDPKGGDLPTNYISVKSASVSPDALTVTRGSTITFVNDDEVVHSFISYDTTTLITGPIAPHTSFIFRKDTTGTFPYHCIEHPGVTGLIIIN